MNNIRKQINSKWHNSIGGNKISPNRKEDQPKQGSLLLSKLGKKIKTNPRDYSRSLTSLGCPTSSGLWYDFDWIT